MRQKFVFDACAVIAGQCDVSVLVVAVKLPNGAVEVIANHSNIAEKLDYYLSAYDENFCLKANSNVQIIGYMLA